MSFFSRETDADLIFRVDRWDDSGNRIDCCVAACITLPLGLAAFNAAVKEYPRAYLTLRNRSWVVRRYQCGSSSSDQDH
jgi:hypothetical protein